MVCEECNLKKGDMPFVEWLKKLSPKCQEMSREVYIRKHGFPPELFGKVKREYNWDKTDYDGFPEIIGLYWVDTGKECK